MSPPGPGEVSPQRWVFFAGKGGVGKTTCAAARALAEAGRGARTLLVSTDPAHSLADALQTRLSARPRELALDSLAAPRGAARGGASARPRRGALFAAELDADAALSRWVAERRRALRTIAQRGTYLDDDDLDEILGLSAPGVDELIGLSELLRLSRLSPAGSGRAGAGKGGAGSGDSFELVIVDTAPTGHTLRLLEMPATLRRLAAVLDVLEEKHRLLARTLGRGAREDEADRVIAAIAAEADELRALLRDPLRCSFSAVLLPEELPLLEAEDALRALAEAGLRVGELVVNRITPPSRGRCALCAGRRAGEARVLRALRAEFPALPLRLLPALEEEPRGLAALSALGRALEKPGRATAAARAARAPVVKPWRTSAEAADSFEWLAPPGTRLLLFGGKGGVGKTTCAAAAALRLSRGGRRVLLLSTDPAHSLGDALAVPLGDDERAVPGAPASLRARELDAPRAFALQRQRYQAAVDQLFDALRGGSRFDASHDRAVVRELIELAPPGLDELFALLAVLDALSPAADAAAAQREATQGSAQLATPARAAPYQLVVVDTAPTGHALRLLQLPQTALSWIHTLLQLLLKYRRVIGLGDLARSLTDTAQQLRGLLELLRDPARARFVVVARPSALPRLETIRLLSALEKLRVSAPIVLMNALTCPGCPRCRRTADREAGEVLRLRRSGLARRCAMLSAPAQAEPPRGVSALLRFSTTWTGMST